jgi:ATP-dependent DNA helicase RecG
MKPSIQKLQKFLQLEAERGYDNRAVVGGLDRMLSHWEAEARVDQVSEELIQAVLTRLRDYPRLTPLSREETLSGLWRRLQRETNTTFPPLPALQQEKDGEQAQKQDYPKQAPARKPDNINGEGHQADTHLPTSAPDRAPRRREPSASSTALNAPVTVLPGIGPRHAQTLSRLGLGTLRDMLHYFPRRYDDYSQLKPINRLFYGEEVTIIATVKEVSVRPIRGGKVQIAEAVINDGTGALRLSWYNQPWAVKRLHQGMPVVVSGKIDQYLGRLVMKNPTWEPIEQQNLHTNRIVPVYPLTANITQRWLRTLMYQVISYWAPRLEDHLPVELREKAGLVDLSTALFEVHFPSSWENLKDARRRLAFDEIFFLQLGMLQQKQAWQSRAARVFEVVDGWWQERIAELPFSLTSAQQQVLADVRSDLASGKPMNRLLQGDVGSGKTVIAALAAAIISRHQAQTALMAPTSILAEQHYQSLTRLLTRKEDPDGSYLKPEEIRLMIGATPEAEKQGIREGLASGEIKLVVGTHALIEDPVEFKDLQLVTVDEQHRFGVEQRALLRSKGDNPHLLVMTATPIPRSLALTLYGDLDLSVMDEMPPGRQPIDTHVLYPRERERAYSLIKSQLEKGYKAFIIYPLVEENEDGDELAAVSESERLQNEVFPRYKVGLLHGRLRPDDKDEVMQRFRDGDVKILVSTSVVEVGVDVPDATVMLVEGANRFGLAQLHQFRGRVGRGPDKSYCLLVPDTPDAVENERLQAMEQTNDGFVLAEKDLEQRGPGEFLGTRQSGHGLGKELRLASLSDIRLIEKARNVALEQFHEDPQLDKPENQLLAAALHRFWGTQPVESKGDIS